MNQLLLILATLAIGATSTFAQAYLHMGSAVVSETPLNTLPQRTVEKVNDGIIVTYDFTGAVIKDVTTNTQSISIPGFNQCGIEGNPAWLTRTDIFPVPNGDDINVNILEATYHDLSFSLAPTLLPTFESDTTTLYTTISPYSGFKPTSIVQELNGADYRGTYLAKIGVAPIQYNHATSTLRVYSHIKYKISYGGAGTYALANNITPTSLLHSLSNDTVPSNSIQSNESYLIITAPRHESLLQPFVDWKQLLGFNVTVLARNDWTSETIKSAVEQQYATDNSLMYLLLVGNNNEVPGMVSDLINTKDLSIQDSTHLTDLYYGCISGEGDTQPDIYRGRWDIQDPFDVEAIVNKIIWHEQTPPLDSLFYRKAAHCAYFQREGENGPSIRIEGRRFVKTSEDVRNYMQSYQSKEVERIYWTPGPTDEDSSPAYWSSIYANGGNLPPDLMIPSAWDGNFNDLVTSINDGRHYVLYRGHGERKGLSSNMGDFPFFDSDYINQLRSTEWQPLFFSLCCSTGQYDSDCFAGQMLRKYGGGAMGVYAASATSYSGYNDALTCGMFNSIWPTPGFNFVGRGFIPYESDGIAYSRLGQILDIGMLKGMSNYSENGALLYTAEVFHLFGDPSVMFHTEVPSEYEYVTIDTTSTCVNVNLNDEVGYISFYDHILDHSTRYYGTSAQYNTNNPENVSVCISGHNKVPYIHHGEEYYPNGEAPSENSNRIISCIDNHNGVITVNYHLTENANNPYIVVVDLNNGNRIIAQQSCDINSTSIGIHAGQGVYAVSLMIDHYPVSTKKIIVHNFL